MMEREGFRRCEKYNGGKFMVPILQNPHTKEYDVDRRSGHQIDIYRREANLQPRENLGSNVDIIPRIYQPKYSSIR